MTQRQDIASLAGSFDSAALVKDAVEFGRRQGMSRQALCLSAGLSCAALYKKDSPYMTVQTAAALAALCDLSLDSYVRAPK